MWKWEEEGRSMQKGRVIGWVELESVRGQARQPKLEGARSELQDRRASSARKLGASPARDQRMFWKKK